MEWYWRRAAGPGHQPDAEGRRAERGRAKARATGGPSRLGEPGGGRPTETAFIKPVLAQIPCQLSFLLQGLMELVIVEHMIVELVYWSVL